MGALFFLFYFAIAIAIAGPFVFFFAFCKWWQKRSRRAIIFLIFASLLLPYSYLCYDAFYPSDNFYKQEFVEITTLPFPKSGEVMRKSASYPDQHGDYASCAQIQVSEDDFERLLQHFKTDSAYAFDSSQFVGGEEFWYVTEGVAPKTFREKFSAGNVVSDAYTFIGFLDDRKTIIIYRVSS